MEELLKMKQEVNALCEHWYQEAIHSENDEDEQIAWNFLLQARQKRNLINDAIDAYNKVVFFDVK